MNSGSVLNIDNVSITSSGTAIENLGTMSITNSTITGNSYAVYDSSININTITNSTLKASTTIYGNGSGTLNVTDTTLNGSINNNNAAQAIKIGVTNKESVNIGTVSNKGNMILNHIKITYNLNSNYNNPSTLVSNSGVLVVGNSNFALTSESHSYIQNRQIMYNTGNLTSTNNTYNVANTYSYKNNDYDQLYGINNTSILTSTNDIYDIQGGRYGYGIFTNSSHDVTITNMNAKVYNIYSNSYGIRAEQGLVTIEAPTIEVYDNQGTSTGIQTVNSSNVVVRNANISLHDNTLSRGFGIGDGTTVTLESGQIDSRGTTAYGTYMGTSTYIQGIRDGSGTDTADVSLTNPSVSATGTTLGNGIYMGGGTFKYYDGYLHGSHGAFASGDIVSETEYRYHVEFTDNDNSCTLRFNM